MNRTIIMILVMCFTVLAVASLGVCIWLSTADDINTYSVQVTHLEAVYQTELLYHYVYGTADSRPVYFNVTPAEYAALEEGDIILVTSGINEKTGRLCNITEIKKEEKQ